MSINRDHVAPVVLSAILYVVAAMGVADIAVNGVLLTPGRTAFYLGTIVVSVIVATIVLAVVAHDRRESKRPALAPQTWTWREWEQDRLERDAA